MHRELQTIAITGEELKKILAYHFYESTEDIASIRCSFWRPENIFGITLDNTDAITIDVAVSQEKATIVPIDINDVLPRQTNGGAQEDSPGLLGKVFGISPRYRATNIAGFVALCLLLTINFLIFFRPCR